MATRDAFAVLGERVFAAETLAHQLFPHRASMGATQPFEEFCKALILARVAYEEWQQAELTAAEDREIDAQNARSAGGLLPIPLDTGDTAP
jgi:hypothetical protein